MSADLLEAFGTSVPAEVDEANHGPAHDQVFPRPKSLSLHHQAPVLQQRPLWEKDNHGTDVLFDASDDGEDDGNEDEFGDFEFAESSNASKPEHPVENPPNASFDLLGLEDALPEEPFKAQSVTIELPQNQDLSNLGVTEPPTNLQHATTRVSDQSLVDDWGAFEEAPVVSEPAIVLEKLNPKPKSPSLSTFDAFEDEEWDAFEDGPAPEKQTNHESIKHVTSPHEGKDVPRQSSYNSTIDLKDKERPTNIPPPFTLLQLLTLAIQNLTSKFKKPLQEQDIENAARSIISLYRTTSRIIAGRSQRWKRDVILAQSMRISTAGHKNTGMKLTSLDRSESIKEDQEAIEAASTWAKHNHLLNPILVRAKMQKPAMNLNASLKIRTLNGPGVLNERDPCVICGLKRNERVIGIDINLDDIFNEFWQEFWGHTECQSFWIEYRGLLAHR